ncbi:MAG: tetratricopeptide repeat protein [Bacteroidia bacterium]|nr:tetratricopeptide repeat protein [Bacteroidia bacterium]
MAKKKKSAPAPVVPELKIPQAAPYASLNPLKNFWLQVVTIAVAGFGLYGNSIQNKTALDDEPVITLNDFVSHGFGGLDSIFKYDSYYCFYRSLGVKDQLPGGRYRPLSIATFAIEWEFFGDNAFVRHLVNVLLYVFSVILLLYFLRKYLLVNVRGGSDIAFLAAFLFLIHPIHTEVVANTKSRDEIISFLFITLTLLLALRYADTGRWKAGAWAAAGYFLALLSKEWAITLVVLVPVMFYLFRQRTWMESLKLSLPFFGVAAVFLFIRAGIVTGLDKEETELLNNPYVLASGSEKVGSKLYVLWKYLSLLLVPYPLSSDYSYNTLPYRTIADPMALFSLLLHLGAATGAIVLLVRRNILAFPILFYIGHLALVSNFRFNVGATMGERLIYHSSFGFLFLISILCVMGAERIKHSGMKRVFMPVLILLLLVPSALIILPRNKQWYNDPALFIHDVNVVPNSAWMNGNAGRCHIVLADSAKDPSEKQKYLDLAKPYLRKAVSIHPGFVNAWFYLGSVHHRQNNIDSAEYCWNQARIYFPNHPGFKTQYDVLLSSHYVKLAEKKVKENDLPGAIPPLEKALKYKPDDAEMWYNLGGIHYTLKDPQKAYEAWTKCLQVKPDHKLAREAVGHLQVQKPNP